TEAALRESEERFRQMAETIQDVFWITDFRVPQILYVSPAYEKIWGRSREEVYGNYTTWLETIHPEDRAKTQATALRCQHSDVVINEYRIVRPDGEIRWICDRGFALRDEAGHIYRVVGIAQDITDRKRVEKALRESVDRLNLALAASYMGDWSWDAATDVVIFSERAAEIFGIPSGPYMTWTQMRELLHEYDRDRARVMVEQAIRERGDYDTEYRVIRPDGVQCWVCAKGRAQYDASGQVLGMFGVVQDITDRKYAEQALQESEAIARARADELEAFMHITPVALWIAHDPNCHHMSANQTAYDLMRTAPGSVATATPADGSYPLPFKQRRNGQEVAPHDLPMQRAARTGQEVKDELEFVFEDGTVRFIYGNAVPLRNEIGDVRGVIGAFVDITERKQAEREREQLLARERTAREEAQAANQIKDEFLAVLSHELRSPLNPILGWTKLLQTRKFDEQATQRALSTIERNAKLQTQLIDDLLDVSRILRGKIDLKVYPVNLAGVIDAALETVRLAAEAKGIEIQTRLAPDVGQVSGDAGRLQQVVLNLVSNAVKFTPSGGRVEIRLERVGRDAQIQVIDTGKGIKPEFLPHVFEYFRQEDGKTTRNFGGLGLGLAIVRHLVELHGGTVQAESPGEGQGATFAVRLPLIAIAKEITQDDTPPIATSRLNRLQILVVDDVADMRELLATILEHYGATVRVAASAAEALIAIEQFKPDLLISDIGMSDIDGYMLLRQVRQLPPERGGLVPAIALTAYASEFDYQQALTAGFQKHIPKPVEPEELVKAITALLVEK
ncbi:MAG TPA: PAS domain S-box protein, partial [Chroococcales cyanobacterium]